MRHFPVLVGLLAATSTAAIAAQPLTMLPSGHVATSVILNGQSFELIVDTAASASVLMPTVREKLSLAPVDGGGHARVHGASGDRPVQLFELESLEVDGRRRARVRAAGMDPVPGSHSAAGILGADTLSSYVAEFDIPAGQLRLHDAGAQLEAAGGWTELAMELNYARFPMLKGELNGKPVTILFDTGARRTLINWAAATEAGANRGDPNLAAADPVRGASAHQVAALARDFDTLQIGSQSFDAKQVTIADLPVFRQLGLEGQPAMILGMDKLRAFRFAVDYGRNRILLARPPAPQ